MNGYDPNGQSSPVGQNSMQGNGDYQSVYGAENGTDQYQGATQSYPPPTPQVQASSPAGVQPTQPQTPHQGYTSGAQAAPVHPEHAKKQGSSSGKTFLIAFAGALVACVLVFGVMSVFNAFSPSNSGVNVTLGTNGVDSAIEVDEDTTLAEAVAVKCLPSVVSVDVYSSAQSQSGSSIYDFFYGYGQGYGQDSSGEVEAGLGSGVVLSEDGYIITNNHVVSGGSSFKVTIAGETYDAELVGQDPSSDVAVLKVDGDGFTPISIGDSDNITIGEWVMSIGSPFGLEQSVATGIVSATSRSQIMDSSEYYGTGSGEMTIYPNMIQTDAAINPGNSGGALVDAKGNLIGINTLITSYSGNYSGVGFAIPVNYALSIAQSLIAGEEPTHAQLGVNLSTVNTQTAQRYNLSVDEGAFVTSVVEGSSAAKAGIQEGDIITSFDGKKITSASDLMLEVRTKNPGDTATVEINRDGQTETLEVELGSATQSSTSTEDTTQQQNSRGNTQNMPFNLFN